MKPGWNDTKSSVIPCLFQCQLYLISRKSDREKSSVLPTAHSDFSCFLLFFQLSPYFIMLQENMATVTITGTFERESRVSQKIRSEKVNVGLFNCLYKTVHVLCNFHYLRSFSHWYRRSR